MRLACKKCCPCSSASKPDDDVVKSLALAVERNDDVVEGDWNTPTDACWKTSALESLKCPELFVSPRRCFFVFRV